MRRTLSLDATVFGLNIFGPGSIASNDKYSSSFNSDSGLLNQECAPWSKPNSCFPSFLPKYAVDIKAASWVSFGMFGFTTNRAISVCSIFLKPFVNFLKKSFFTKLWVIVVVVSGLGHSIPECLKKVGSWILINISWRFSFKPKFFGDVEA